MESDLSDILAFADSLSDIDTTGIEPTAHAVPMFNVMREDEVGQPMDRQALLGGAPQSFGDYILVPRVVE
jgi:aspartyl-tRNA(Asn)/glutamyl-tRNA(Gln) amidotransferase subunit C